MFKSIVIVGIIIVINVSTEAVPLMCLRYCGNLDYNPICGYNGRELKIFNNECELKNSECGEQITWKHRTIDECHTEVQKNIGFEPALPDSSNDNLNLILITALFKSHDVKMIQSCPPYCPEGFRPICAFNGTSYKTFFSMCFMEMENCFYGNTYEIAPDVKCNIGTTTEAYITTEDET